MWHRPTFCFGVMVVGVVLAVSGCSPSSSPPDNTQPAGAQSGSPQKLPEAPTSTTSESGDKAQQGGHEEHGHASHQIGGEGLAQLSDADRALAEKQRVCPVSGELLGTMGKPVKVEVKGQTVFLCCPDCQDKIKADPDKYLAKLKTAGTE